ncbi:MAG: DUF2190 family protein [Nitrosopumilus sp.]
MANEAKLVQDLEFRHLEVTMADGSSGTDIPLGTILKLDDPNTGSAGSADNDIFLGILLVDNEGGDGQVRYALSRKGVWDIKASNATIAAGKIVMMKGANLVAETDAAVTEQGQNVGMALQTAATNEVIEVLVGAFG